MSGRSARRWRRQAWPWWSISCWRSALLARLKRLRAKNDRIDARLIAATTAQVDTLRAAHDPRLADLAEQLTAYEQVTDQAAELKTFREHLTLADLVQAIDAQIASLLSLKARLLAKVLAGLKAHADLAQRVALLTSLPGFGPVVAASLVIRMPELGAMKQGQAAALIGVAPSTATPASGRDSASLAAAATGRAECSSCKVSIGCPSGPGRGGWSCEASAILGGPDEPA